MNVGDVVEINGGRGSSEWKGLRARVTETLGTDFLLTPLTDRPDGQGRSLFMWPLSDLSVVRNLCQGCQNDDGCYADKPGDCDNLSVTYATVANFLSEEGPLVAYSATTGEVLRFFAGLHTLPKDVMLTDYFGDPMILCREVTTYEPI